MPNKTALGKKAVADCNLKVMMVAACVQFSVGLPTTGTSMIK